MGAPTTLGWAIPWYATVPVGTRIPICPMHTRAGDVADCAMLIKMVKSVDCVFDLIKMVKSVD